MKITNFFEKNYLTYAQYNVLRMLANYIDGQKISSRKVVHVISEDNSDDYIKTAQLGPRVADRTQYLHNETIISGVIANMVRDYVGTNNITFIDKMGNFGTRFINSPAAPRYTKVKKSKKFNKIFNPIDNILCKKHKGQTFEGVEIEPIFYMPTIPLVLVNGTNGIASGYAQKILPRNLKDILREVGNYLKGKKINRIIPFFNGYTGKVYFDKDNVVIRGNIEKNKNNVITITEIPVTYDLDGYTKVLNKLLDDKKINDYKDLSDGDKFRFEIKVNKEVYNQSEDKIINLLKLEKRVVENFTLLDEDNKIVVFNDETELLEKFIKLRLKYYDLRKEYIISELKSKISKTSEIWRFISEKIKGEIKVDNVKKDDIEKQLEKHKFPKIDGDYEYLFSLKVYNFTQEKIDELKNKISEMKNECDITEKTKIEQFWISDLKELI